MSKWAGTLSTTEPYNHLGLLPVRQSNRNSEVFEFKIVQNSLPYNLTGYRVLFCTHFEPYISIEKEAKVIDEVNGLIQFTMDNDCMQKIGNQEAYFEIYKEDTFMDSTQNFTYTIQVSIEKQLMDGESYIQRLEEILKRLKDQMEKSQAEIDKWLSDNRKEIDDLMNEMEQFFTDKKNEFSDWFESVREILESIDPGGVLLSEIVMARTSRHSNKTFKSLAERLEFMENAHYTESYRFANCTRTLCDNLFSKNHTVTKIGTVTTNSNLPGLIYATVDDTVQDTFYLRKVGD